MTHAQKSDVTDVISKMTLHNAKDEPKKDEKTSVPMQAPTSDPNILENMAVPLMMPQ